MARSSVTPPPADDALVDGGLGGVHGVLDASLLLLHLGLGRGTDADHGDAADQLRQALLELLAVVVGGGLLDLVADLASRGRRWPHGAARPTVSVTIGGVCPWSMTTFLASAEVVPLDVLELDAEVLGDAPCRR